MTKLTDEQIATARAHKKKVQVWTPPEIISFIENSIDHILKTEFGQDEGINSKDIHIIDPFAGEANFTTVGLDQNIITKETAARIEHMEILPESVEIAKKELQKRGVKNPIIHNIDTFNQDPRGQEC